MQRFTSQKLPPYISCCNQTQMTKLNKCNQFNPLFTFLFLLADLHNLMNFSETQDQIFAITTITRIHHGKIYAKYGTKELHEKKKFTQIHKFET